MHYCCSTLNCGGCSESWFQLLSLLRFFLHQDMQPEFSQDICKVSEFYCLLQDMVRYLNSLSMQDDQIFVEDGPRVTWEVWIINKESVLSAIASPGRHNRKGR